MAASGILIPLQLAPYPVRALEYVINRAQAIEEARSESVPILGIVISMFDRTSTKFNNEMLEKIRELLAKVPNGQTIEIFPTKTWIPRLKIVSATSDKGYPLSHTEFDDSLTRPDKDSANDAFDAYLKMAQHLIEKKEVNQL
jgi:cellulose biosynthesis protein BcsQ